MNAALGIAVEPGAVVRTGAMGRIRSFSLRDPDGNPFALVPPATVS